MHPRARGNRWFQALLIVAGTALGLGWFAARNSPAEQFRHGLRSLRAKNPEGLHYALLSLGDRPELESQTGLLQGWLRLQGLRPGDASGLKDALTELDLAASDEQNRALALALVGRALYEQRRMREAMNRLSQSLEADPDEVEAHRWLGVAFYDIGNVALALPHLERVAKLEPHNGRPHRLIGIIFRDLLQYDQAAEAYRASLSRDPHQPDAEEIRQELGRCELSELQYDEALATLKSCRETAEVLTLQAQCYHAKGLVDAAKQAIDRALALEPDRAEALAVQATLAEGDGDYQLAARLLGKAVEQRPHEYTLRYRLAQLYSRTGQQELADEQRGAMEELRALRDDLNTLIEQANLDGGNAQIRYGIAALAERLDLPEMASSWRKAAEMLDSMGSN